MHLEDARLSRPRKWSSSHVGLRPEYPIIGGYSFPMELIMKKLYISMIMPTAGCGIQSGGEMDVYTFVLELIVAAGP